MFAYKSQRIVLEYLSKLHSFLPFCTSNSLLYAPYKHNAMKYITSFVALAAVSAGIGSVAAQNTGDVTWFYPGVRSFCCRLLGSNIQRFDLIFFFLDR